ncbi:hypothetical protein [Halogeometricum limi]|uniref:Lipoprotein n=1 Tax=Halogeometricum limi TaxID=555875 RepID=A0A1I6GTZ0_9EURY|nr:hypothetical protein [Halogeometricum limi]SFR45672.1 hypothetical protein SAMN04488124_1530 [Halogeometricum limi]
MRRLPLCGLIFVFVLAGCVGSPLLNPGPQERPVMMNLSNEANETYTLELWTAESPLDVRVIQTNGSDYTTQMGNAGVGVYDTGVSQTTSSLQFPERATLYGRYTLNPGESQQWAMQEPYYDTVFVVVVYADDHVIGWVETSCAGGVKLGFDVVVANYGPSGSYGCI